MKIWRDVVFCLIKDGKGDFSQGAGACNRPEVLMVRNRQKGIAAMICLLSGGLLVSSAPPAYSQSFFDRLFNTRSYQELRKKKMKEAEELEKKKTVRVRVSSPRYYTYKPDKLIAVSLKPLAAVETAMAEPADDYDAVLSDGNNATPVPLSPFDRARPSLSGFKIRTLKSVGQALLAYYKENPGFLWITDGRINGKAREALAAFEQAGEFGLVPADYRVSLPADSSADTLDNSGTLDPDAERRKKLIQLEMTLSAHILTYVLDATRGRIAPNRLSGYHDFARKKVDLTAALKEIAASDNIAAYLKGRHPDNAKFRALAAELKRLQGSEEENTIEIAAGTLLKPGGKSAELVNIVAAIRLRGSDILKTKHAETLAAYDGGEDYTAELVALVRDYQREKKLRPDGIIGRRTIRALVKVNGRKARIAKIRLAMERLRWLPRRLGNRYVIINQPAFTASFVNQGRETLSMRVVIGKKSNQTYFFADKIETVEYNPYWGVPLSIIVNEMLPKLSADPSYLDRIGYEVTTVSGRRVSSSSVDWYSVASRKLPINVRQLPGRRNALGQLKILFPNKHAIYMHDTPSKSLFKRDRRAFSHGCVRLQDPRAMAAAVLGTDKNYIAERIAGGKNDSDPVTGNIPVYVAYFTAWPKAAGSIGFFDDVYDRDKYLTRAMDRTTKYRQTGVLALKKNRKRLQRRLTKQS
jgi:murein L,D-transpeptidase YcbB/YkuD